MCVVAGGGLHVCLEDFRSPCKEEDTICYMIVYKKKISQLFKETITILVTKSWVKYLSVLLQGNLENSIFNNISGINIVTFGLFCLMFNLWQSVGKILKVQLGSTQSGLIQR